MNSLREFATKYNVEITLAALAIATLALISCGSA